MTTLNGKGIFGDIAIGKVQSWNSLQYFRKSVETPAAVISLTERGLRMGIDVLVSVSSGLVLAVREKYEVLI